MFDTIIRQELEQLAYCYGTETVERVASDWITVLRLQREMSAQTRKLERLGQRSLDLS